MTHRYGIYKLDASTYCMVLVTKLWAFSFSYKDGGENPSKLTPSQNALKVLHLPTYIEFLSYVSHSSGCLSGPFMEFADFKNWIEFEGHYKTLPRGKEGWKNLWPAVKKWSGGFISIVITLALNLGLDVSIQNCGKADFKDRGGFLFKCIYTMAAMLSQRTIFYVAWCFTDGAQIACGLAYNGPGKWDRVVSVDIWEIEFGLSASNMLKGWNHGTHIWLKNYVMARLVEKD